MIEVVALIMNNLALLAASGALAIFVAWRAWVKFEGYHRSIGSWSELVFAGAKAIVIIAIIAYVGGEIWRFATNASGAIVDSGMLEVGAQVVTDTAAGFEMLANEAGTLDLDMGTFDAGTGNSFDSFAREWERATGETIEEGMDAMNAEATDSATESASVEDAQDGTYTVRRGDSMFAIAQRIYGDGDRYFSLCQANRSIVGQRCDLLKAGMVLTIPAKPAVAPTLAPVDRWDAAVAQWTSKRPVPTATPYVAPTPTAFVDLYAPAMGPAEQATKDANGWNVRFGQ